MPEVHTLIRKKKAQTHERASLWSDRASTYPELFSLLFARGSVRVYVSFGPIRSGGKPRIFFTMCTVEFPFELCRVYYKLQNHPAFTFNTLRLILQFLQFFQQNARIAKKNQNIENYWINPNHDLRWKLGNWEMVGRKFLPTIRKLFSFTEPSALLCNIYIFL